MQRATRRGLAAVLVLAGLAIAPATVVVPPTAAAGMNASSLHKFEGPITSINRDKHKFRINDEDRGIVKIKANRKTRYQRLSGFGALHKGLRVEVKAHRKDGRWIADKIERKA